MTLLEDVRRIIANEFFERRTMRHGVALEPYVTEIYIDGTTAGYRLYMTAVEPRAMPATVFVYQRKSILTPTTPYKDDFSHVASIPDLVEFPVDVPITGAQRQFFRLNYVDLVFRNPSMLLDAVRCISRDLAELVWAFEQNDPLIQAGIINIGNPMLLQVAQPPTTCNSITTAVNQLVALHPYEKASFDYGLALNTFVPEIFTEGRTVGFRLYVQAINPREMPPEIFLYERKPIIDGENPYKDEFYHVSSVPDLTAYPVGAPAIGAQRQFFRLDYVDLTFRSPELLISALGSLATETAQLVFSRQQIDTMAAAGYINIGNPSSGSSSSSSGSPERSYGFETRLTSALTFNATTREFKIVPIS